jgi:hypothetical protein
MRGDLRAHDAGTEHGDAAHGERSRREQSAAKSDFGVRATSRLIALTPKSRNARTYTSTASKTPSRWRRNRP